MLKTKNKYIKTYKQRNKYKHDADYLNIWILFLS